MLRNFSIAELNEVRKSKRPICDQNESDINDYILSAIHIAVLTKCTLAAQILLEKGVDVHLPMITGAKLSSHFFAAMKGETKMKAILSKYGGGNEAFPDYHLENDPFMRRIFQRSMRCRGLDGSVPNGLDGKEVSALFAVSNAHEFLLQILIFRDDCFSKSLMDKMPTQFNLWFLDEFRALITNESITGYIDTPDEDGITMLQRAAAFLDIEIVRLLLEVGADANVTCLAPMLPANESESNLTLLPFQIACLMGRVEAGNLKRETIRAIEQSDAISTNQVILKPTRKPRILSHVSGTGAKRIKDIIRDPDLLSEPKVVESLRASSLNLAQEPLRWHLLRNDRQFEGITEFHLCTYTGHVSRSLMLLRKKVEIWDAKASWPGLEGKYTGYELSSLPWKDVTSAFLSNFERLRGNKLDRNLRNRRFGSGPETWNNPHSQASWMKPREQLDAEPGVE